MRYVAPAPILDREFHHDREPRTKQYRRAPAVAAGFLLLLLVLTSLSGVLWQSPGNARAASSDGWILGRVTDGAAPIQNACVVYGLMAGGPSGPQGMTTTNETGYYNFTVFGGVMYMVIAMNGSHYSEGVTVTSVPGLEVWTNLTLSPIAPVVADVILTGYVLDSDGNPVPGGTVLGYVNDPANGGEGFPLYGNATSADPSTGRYTVNVIPGPIGGGVGALDFPGYGFIENSTNAPFVSGQTYWINISLSNPPSTDDAVLTGTVTDNTTGAPIENVVVTIESYNQWMGSDRYANLTLTGLGGSYEMNVTNGSARIMFQTAHYSMVEVDEIQIDPGSRVVVNATLLPTNATVSGNVTDLKTGLPLAGAMVFLRDDASHLTIATTNSSGYYSLEAFVSPSEMLGAEFEGYSRNMSAITIDPGDHIWRDIGLMPHDAWLSGRVTDLVNGTPVDEAGISLYSATASFGSKTNSSGAYNISLESGNYTVRVDTNEYRPYYATVQILPGANIWDVALMPSMLPYTTRLYGWVNDSVSGTGIPDSDVRAALMPSYYGDLVRNSTNDTGYYELWVPPLLLQYVAMAQDHEHAEQLVNATGLTEVRVDVSLDSDPWSPNVTCSQSPTSNISWTNPSSFQATVQEADPQWFALMFFMFVNASSGNSDYALVQTYSDNFDPLSQESDRLPYTKVGDNYTISLQWSATAMGGWLHNGSAGHFFGVFEAQMGPQKYLGLRGMYYNSTLGSSHRGTAWFDNATGAFEFFSFDDGMMSHASPADLSGMVSPQVPVIRVNNTTNGTMWYDAYAQGNWSVVGLQLTFDSVLPSGDYLAVFSASDFGWRSAGNGTHVTVDNNPPEANAGSDQTVLPGQPVFFNGTGSADNVGIVNYTWTFNDGGTPVTLWGPNPDFTFLSEGVYEVTLTVTDGAGHTATGVVNITVSAVIPEFSTVIIPVSGMLLIVAAAAARRSRRDG